MELAFNSNISDPPISDSPPFSDSPPVLVPVPVQHTLIENQDIMNQDIMNQLTSDEIDCIHCSQLFIPIEDFQQNPFYVCSPICWFNERNKKQDQKITNSMELTEYCELNGQELLYFDLQFSLNPQWVKPAWFSNMMEYAKNLHKKEKWTLDQFDFVLFGLDRFTLSANHDKLNISKITDFSSIGNIFISSIIPAMHSFTYKRNNIGLVINLSRKEYKCPVDDAKLIHYPIEDDGKKSDIMNFITYFKEILDTIRRKRNVLIHCRAGISRSVTFVWLFLGCFLYGQTPPMIVLHNIRLKRPIANPNEDFIGQVVDFFENSNNLQTIIKLMFHYVNE